MENIINKIEQKLKEMGKTKKELADFMEVKPQRLSNWFMRKSIPNNYIIDIAKFLNTTVESLYSDDDTIPLTHYLPVIGEASCGVPTNHFFYEDYDKIPVPAELYREGRYAVKAVGDSMTPKINGGNIVLCDTQAYIDNNNIVHYTLNGESGIKKVVMGADNKPVMLIPLNDRYSIIIINKDDDLKMAKCFKVITDL
jgi:repressor LexA